jgi:hypothetical protein
LFLVKAESRSILYLINNLVCKENMSYWIYVYIEVTCVYNQTTNVSILIWCQIIIQTIRVISPFLYEKCIFPIPVPSTDNVSDCTKDNADYCFFPFKFMFL